MILHQLLESVQAAKKIALTFQHAFLTIAEENDIDDHVTLKLVAVSPGWRLGEPNDKQGWTVAYKLHSVVKLDVEVLIMVRDDDPLVQVYMTAAAGGAFAYITDMTEVKTAEEMEHAAIDVLEGVFERAGRIAIESLNRDVAEYRSMHKLSGSLSMWSTQDQLKYANIPIPYAISTSSSLSLLTKIGKASLQGYKIHSIAIYRGKLPEDAISWAKAQNDFNDRVLRKAPKPLQLHVAVDQANDAAVFVYGTKA